MRKYIIPIILVTIISCTKKEEVVTPEVKTIVIEEVKPKSLTYNITIDQGFSNHGALSYPGPDTQVYYNSSITSDDVKYSLAYKESLIVVYLDGRVEALSLTDNTKQWESIITYGNYLKPVVADDKFIILSTNGHLTSLDVNSGRDYLKYSYSDGFYYHPIVVDKKIYTVNSRGELLVITKDQDIKELPLNINKIGNWIFEESYIYCFDTLGNLIKIDLSDNSSKELFKVEESLYSNLSGGLGYLFIQNSELTIYDINSLDLIKKESNLTKIAPPASLHNGEYVGVSRKGRIYLGALGKEELIWSKELPENVENRPLISSDVIYVTGKNNLYILSRRDGEILTTYKTESQIISTPIVLRDYIFLTTETGIYKLGREKSQADKEPWKSVYKELKLDDEAYYILPEEGLYFKFVPKETGFYSLISDTMEESPVEIEILNGIGHSLYINVDYASAEKKFTNEFFKGEEYYIHCKPINSDGGEFHLKVK